MNLASRLRERRERRNLKNSQVALYLGLSTAHVSNIESGTREPSLDLLVRLAEYYRCSVDYLLGITDDPRPASQQSVSEAAVDAINLIDSLPPEKRPSAVELLRAIIVFADVGVPLPEMEVVTELVGRDAGASTKSAPTWEVGAGKQGHRQLGLPDMEDDEWTSIRKDALLALLKKALPADEFEKLKESVDAGRPLSESELFRLRQILGNTGLKQFFKLPDDNGTISNG